MTLLTHRLECGHVLAEEQGNSASPRQHAFCDPCKAHVSVISTASQVGETFVEEIPGAESQTAISTESDITINISEDSTPEIHLDADADDLDDPL